MKFNIGFIATAFYCFAGVSEVLGSINLFTFNVNSIGGSTYVNSQTGTILAIGSSGSPSNPSGYDSLSGLVSAGAALSKAVGPSSVLSSFAYISPSSQQRVIRIFYQATDGTIVSLYHSDTNSSPTFSPDSTVIASGVPVGSTFVASGIVISNTFAMIIQYLDSNGVLTQRWSTSDTLNSVWSAPVSVPIPLVDPREFTLNVNTFGGSTYINAQNGTLFAVGSAGSPSSPSGYNSLNVGTLGSQTPTNVAPSSVVGSFQYTSTTTGSRAIRVFYQDTSGNIRSLYHDDSRVTLPVFSLDSTVIATGLPLGSQFAVSALVQPNSVNSFVMIIQYIDGNGNLNQRWSISDAVNSVWSSPVIA